MIGGTDIPIIFIATDRRSKSDNLLSKLFSIGIYDALLGSDRSIPEVCKLLNKPRTKREAKTYYKIETEEVNYQAEAEDNVSETEIQNILMHYKKLGKNTERYVDSFNNIAAQYSDAQLRIITKFLPIGVKAVLEAESPKYQSIMTFGEGTYKKQEKAKEEKKEDLKIGFIETNSAKSRPTKPVVIPSAVNKENAQKLTKRVEEPQRPPRSVPKAPEVNEQMQIGEDPFEDIMGELNNEVSTAPKTTEIQEEPVKKRRGRPKKELTPEEAVEAAKPKKRGRPKKVVEEVSEEEPKETILPGFDEIEENTLPGFDEIEENTLPGFEDEEPEPFAPKFNTNTNPFESRREETSEIEVTNTSRDYSGLTNYLSRDKKVVAFLGATKAGTSFLVNNIADLLSKSGISTAILDVTSNRNSYYIYTKNEEPLRRKVLNCLESLEQDIVDGIEVSRNLTVFTSVPGKKIEVQDVEAVVAALIKKFSLVILDCDFTTPFEYFGIAQEVYLVQTMDILTIQPLTAFLRDLQSNGVLVPSKLKIVINKAMRVRGLNTNAIIGGMSCYNDPEMSYMRNLFDKDKIKAITISFDGEVLSKYLSGMVDCIVTTNGYSKGFISELKKLADMVYPLINGRFKTDYKKNNKFAKEREEGQAEQDNFSNNMKSTLNRMKDQLK
ncbi:MAG: hypothetical protein HFJ54_01115 [Clostridia bacterium]|nr:hypothetical protein [Clostridia bacterium]